MVWTVVIPVKPAAIGKSRLGRTPEVARAIALDTIDAAARAGTFVTVVTSDLELAARALDLNAEVMIEDEPTGLDAAIAAGLLPGWRDRPRAVLLGDLPALDPLDLIAALSAASDHPHAFVADAEGLGSTLVTAAAGLAFEHAFGEGSAQRHRDLGFVDLDIPVTSTLRRDVDLDEHLAAIPIERLGPRTRAALRG